MHSAKVAGLIACCAALAGAVRAQTSEAAALNQIREYALSYAKALPNYPCTQTNRQTIAIYDFKLTESKEFDCGSKQNTWFATPAIALAEGHRGAPQPAAEATSSRGEFAKLLDTIFEPETGADFRWDRLSMLNGRRVNVFGFHVPQSRGYSLVESARTIQVAFKGFVYADSQTGAVVRIEMKCIDIPGDSEYTAADLTLDYKRELVAGVELILPGHYLAHFRMVRGEVTDEAAFTAYRRFSADSTLQFEDVTP